MPTLSLWTCPTDRKDHRPGREQPVQVAFDWDQLRELVEDGRYGNSQQLLAVIWSAAIVGEAAEIVIWCSPTVVLTLDTNKREREAYFQFEILENGPLVGLG